MAGAKNEGTDAGYFFSGPFVEERRKTVKPGMVLIDNHRSGVIIGENPGSPWHQSTFYSQGSILRDSEGMFIRQVALCETTDPDGDLTWSVLWEPRKGQGTYSLVVGTGKWKGIAGEGRMAGVVRGRADDHTMPRYELRWKVDEENDGKVEAFAPSSPYTNHATSLSFHGPHVSESMKELANGLKLEVSTQAGVLIGEDPSVPSPRSYATCYDRGTTLWSEGKRLADIMLLEDTDPDGDMAWLIHVWWYARGRGLYKFIGGTGKWEGIRGEGVTLGMLRARTDDHYMLRSEIRWRINRER
jgi:hypothetical protein